MINRSTEGILYPQDCTFNDFVPDKVALPYLMIVPCKSWNYIESDLKEAFKKVCGCKAENIFVFSKLKNGKIGFEDPFTIYTDSDCGISDDVLTKSDDVCSEEFAAEILNPFFNCFFKDAKINQFLTTEKNEKNTVFFNKLWKEYPNSLFIICRNDQEDSVWPENPQD